MTTYKTFFKLIKSHINTIIMYFIIFSVLTFVLSNVLPDKQTYFQETELEMSIIDKDNSTLSKALISHMDASQKLVKVDNTKEAWTDALFSRASEYILIIPENFEKDVLSGKTDLLSNYKLPGSTSGTFIDMQIDEYMNTITTFINLGETVADAIADTDDTFKLSGNVTLANMSSSEETQPAHYFFFQYLAYIFICLLITALGPVLMAFRKSDLKKRLDCSARSLTSRNLELIISSILFSIIIWILFMILGFIQNHELIFTRDYMLLMLNSLVYIIMVLAFTYMIIHFVKDANVLNMISNVFGLGSSFLCGIFVPQYLLGDGVMFIAQFLPPYWYLEAMNNIATGNVTGYIIDLFIILGYTLAFLVIAMVASKQTANANA